MTRASTASSMDCAYNVAYLRRGDGAATGSAGAGPIGTRSTTSITACRASGSRALYREADALINLCGATRLRDEHMACPVRIMIDTDPVYEQIKYAEADPRGARLSRRAHAFLHLWRECRRRRAGSCRCAAFPGSRRGRRSCSSCGRRRRARRDCFTTIATWENKGKNIEFGGETYVWSKHVNFLRFLDLPQRGRRLLHAWRCCRRRRRSRREVDGRRLAPRRSAPGLGRHGRYARFHPRLARRVHRRQGHLCPAEERLVQRPQRLLPRRRAARSSPCATGFEPVLSGGRGPVRISPTRDEALAAIAAIAADYPPPQPRRARRWRAEYFAQRPRCLAR